MDLTATKLQMLRQELRRIFQNHGIESPEADAGLLLMEVLGIDKTRLLIENMEVTPKQQAHIATLVKRRLAGEPVQYIIGRCPFMELTFAVNPSTLIPRPETELLVEAVQDRLMVKDQPLVLWDIGCGSGCIGITLAYHFPALQVVEVDISAKALETANGTAEQYGLAHRISFVEHDILQGMPDLPQPQVIVSNPPYIPEGEIAKLQKEVRDFEPLSALSGGADGLCFYRKIIADAPLPAGGLLAFEIGYNQGPAVLGLMQEHGYREVQLLQDFAGLDRIVLGYR